GSSPGGLWWVPRAAFPAGPHLSLQPAQAPLWGMGKVLALEYPESWGAMIDLPPVATDNELSMLWADIARPSAEDHIAFRDGQRLVARLARLRPGESHKVQLQPDASYLITGGLGTLGLRVAQWMAQHGARHLVLTARRAPSPQTLETFSRIGAQILPAQADVSDLPAMAALFARIESSLPPLRGIVHAAGLPGFQALQDM